MLSRAFKTKAQRSFAVILVVLLAGAIGAATKTEDLIEPTRWYFFTIYGSEIDIRSPTRRLIVGTDMYPVGSEHNYAELRRRVQQRCEFELHNAQPGTILGSTYRGLRLCNTQDIPGEFAIRDRHFRTRVDALYQKYYVERVTHYSLYVGAALAIWIALLGCWFTIRWISRGA